jgi:hypothetical protein
VSLANLIISALVVAAAVGSGLVVGRVTAHDRLLRVKYAELLEALADDDAGWIAWLQSNVNSVGYHSYTN